ncbi:MAG: ribonuclease H-like domain-containing protein [Candidatus Woesearchaeota archaeon]|nr:ribonuclease H-like domain-containing protein [Candidatus Woesearchaeota archaeon]
MIRSTFLFLPKIKQKKERSLWDRGIRTWDDFLSHEIKGISKKRKLAYDEEIKIAKRALFENDSGYFKDRLPGTETWRLYDYFREEAVFLDIEASGSSRAGSYLTVIGLFDGIDTKTMVKDMNLDVQALQKELMRYKLLITFNGSSFDIPFLEKKYPRLIPDIPHIDIRHLCARIGLKGGLKDIEKQLGISRDNEVVKRMYGGDPIKLWRMYKGSRDPYYLELLVEYNEEDVINLKRIIDSIMPRLKKLYFHID